MPFSGNSDYAMDERGRVPLPPRYRDAFRNGVVLSQGSPDKCVRVYTREAWDAEADHVMREPARRRRGKHLRWSFFSRSHETELDRQNRILIPASLRAAAGLGGTVLVIGAGECLEIWSPEAYAAVMELVDDQLETTLESVETREP